MATHKVTKTLNQTTTDTNGVCDLCGLPTTKHPCAEHRQAMFAAQIDAAVTEQDKKWAPFLGVATALPQPGKL